MSGSWRLILPGRRYLPPAASEDPIAAELRSLARQDLAADRTVGDWSDDERERLLGDRQALPSLAVFRHVRDNAERVLQDCCDVLSAQELPSEDSTLCLVAHYVECMVEAAVHHIAVELHDVVQRAVALPRVYR